MTQPIAQRFLAARKDPGLTVLEGFHALKHALRFGAEVVEVVTTDAEQLELLARELAPELAGRLQQLAVPLEPAQFEQLAPRAPRTGVLAIARRPPVDVAGVLADPRPAPVVLLEDPRTMGNLGACVRVAAAADAAAVLTTGVSDPWHPDAVKGGAGLQFALPVARLAESPADFRAHCTAAGRVLVAVDPGGEELDAGELPRRAVLAFGTERLGLSEQLLAVCDERMRLQMRSGVSSLNLATAVAATLFSGWRVRDAG